MSNIGNQRVSQLVELTSNEIVPQDVLLIIDVDAAESKKIQISELGLWLNESASFYVVHAILADTASYILGSNIVGLVNSSSYALMCSTASFAQIAGNTISSSYALTASFALNEMSSSLSTSSYLLYQGFSNGTSSYALNSNTANAALSAAFLVYSLNNGTASYAITTQNVTTAATASYINNISGSIATASYALFAQQAAVGSASYLIFSPNNGTASYAMASQAIANVIVDYGIFLAYTQSVYESQLDDVDILWSTEAEATTPIEAVGTVIIPFTGSSITNGTVYLSTIDRNTGLQTILDSTPIYFSSTSDSGSIKIPFSLMGQSNFYGSYMVFVSSSNNIQIEPTRTVRFNISSESDTVSSYPNVPLSFSVVPNNVTFSFTNNSGNVFTDNLAGMLSSGSGNIYTLSAINQGVASVEYFWTLYNVTASNFSNNPLSQFSGVPNSLTYLSCSNGSLSSLYTFQSSSLSVFNCSGNGITSLPNFPVSMSYFNCSSNPLLSLNLPATLSYLDCSNDILTSFPTYLPYGLTVLLANNNNISSLPSSPNLPNTIISMSLNNNVSLTPITSLPLSLSYFSINNCSLCNILPTIPSEVLYLSAQSCSLFSTSMDDITSDLLSNAMSNTLISGTVDLRGNGSVSIAAKNNMLQLQTYGGWTTLYDNM